MNDLRWALLIVGGVILLLIYVWTVWVKGNKKRVPPVWDGEQGEGFYSEEPNSETLVDELTGIGQLVAEDCPRRNENCPDKEAGTDSRADAMDQRPQPDANGAGNSVPDKPPIDMPEEVFVVYIVAPTSSVFEGPDILRALEKVGMSFGAKKIFHRLSGGGETVFGVADMLEPGVLIPEELANHSTPGLTIFLQLPGPVDSLDACEDYMRTARTLAAELGGELRDQRRSVLTQQALEHMRERVMEHRRKEELARRKQHS